MMECETCKTLHAHVRTFSPSGVVMSNTINHIEPGDNTGPGRTELLEKLHRLEKRFTDLTGAKKSMAADYNDQLKDVRSEMEAVMADLDNAPAGS